MSKRLKSLVIKAIAAVLAGNFSLVSSADEFSDLAKRCAPSVAEDTLRALVATESSFNPYAIGVVGSSVKQPTSFHEAMSTIATLEIDGANYSVGLAQINKSNFKKFGINAAKALDSCTNLQVAARILGECFTRAQRSGVPEEEALHNALSCYYSGNFKTGYKHGYVNSVRIHAGMPAQVPSISEPQKFSFGAAKAVPNQSQDSLVQSTTEDKRGLIF